MDSVGRPRYTLTFPASFVKNVGENLGNIGPAIDEGT
jgi:hypothetical protein